MKNIIIPILLSVVCLFSCTKNENGGVGGQTFNMQLGAIMPDFEGDDAKTHQTDRLVTKWLYGDQLFYSEDNVTVSSKSTTNNRSTNVKGNDSRGVFPIMATAGKKYYAVYPYSGVTSVTGRTASITIPTTQTNSETFNQYSGGIANNAEILYASQDGTNGGFNISGTEPYVVKFKRATSVLRLRLVDIGYKIPEIEKVLSATITIDGTYIVGSGSMNLSDGSLSGFNTNTITLKYDSNNTDFPNFTGVPYNSDAFSRCCDLYAVVAPATIAKNKLIKVEVHTDNFDLTFDNNSHNAIPLEKNKVTTVNLKITNVKLNSAAQGKTYYWNFGDKSGLSDAKGTYGGSSPKYNLTSPLAGYGEQQYATLETMVKINSDALDKFAQAVNAGGASGNWLNQVMGFDERFFIRLIQVGTGYSYQGVVYSTDNSKSMTPQPGKPIDVTKWHHVALSFAGDGSGGTATLCIDGEIAAQSYANGLNKISFANTQSTIMPYSSFTLAATAAGTNAWSNRFLLGSLAQSRIWAGSAAASNYASNACRSPQDLKRNRLLLPTTRCGYAYSKYTNNSGLIAMWLVVDGNPGGNPVNNSIGLQIDWGAKTPGAAALSIFNQGGTIGTSYSL